MRVIGGVLRSRPLVAPAGLDTRPTTDRLRETLFNVLIHGAVNRIEGASFLDLYAGSGAVGIEAFSRGASSVTFVEQNLEALQFLRKNIQTLGIQKGISVERRKVLAYLLDSTRSFNVIYLDPPYDSLEEYTRTFQLLGGDRISLLAPEAVVIAEHRRKSIFDEQYGHLVRTRTLQQGDAGLSFYHIRQVENEQVLQDPLNGE